MTHEQIPLILQPSVNLVRSHLIKVDGNGYCNFMDELHACATVCDLKDLLQSVASQRWQYDVIDLLPPSETEDLSPELQDRLASFDVLDRIHNYFDDETFARQFPLTFRYAILGIHPETR